MIPRVCERARRRRGVCHGCEQLDGGHRLCEAAVSRSLHRAEHADKSDGEYVPRGDWEGLGLRESWREKRLRQRGGLSAGTIRVVRAWVVCAWTAGSLGREGASVVGEPHLERVDGDEPAALVGRAGELCDGGLPGDMWGNARLVEVGAMMGQRLYEYNNSGANVASESEPTSNLSTSTEAAEASAASAAASRRSVAHAWPMVAKGTAPSPAPSASPGSAVLGITRSEPCASKVS